MNALELLESYDKACLVVKQFYLNKLLESLKSEDVPDYYKEFVKAQDFGNQDIAKMIEANSRNLFDVFDSNDIYIEILVDHTKADVEFAATVIDGDIYACPGNYKHRIEAEKVAVEKAFEMLNKKL